MDLSPPWCTHSPSLVHAWAPSSILAWSVHLAPPTLCQVASPSPTWRVFSRKAAKAACCACCARRSARHGCIAWAGMAFEARTERAGTRRRGQSDARRSDGACTRPSGEAGRRRAGTQRTKRADETHARGNAANGNVGDGGRAAPNARTHRESLHLLSTGNSTACDENRRTKATRRSALEREHGPPLQCHIASCSAHRRVSREAKHMQIWSVVAWMTDNPCVQCRAFIEYFRSAPSPLARFSSDKNKVQLEVRSIRGS